ncbi:MAG: hypothetical protein RLZZ455_1129 [Candidatus Parcubacteria bacterium]
MARRTRLSNETREASLNWHSIWRIAHGKTQIVDPTWHQFLETPNGELPRVLQVPVEKLEETAGSYGIPRGEAQKVAWLRRVEQGIDFDDQQREDA